MFLIILIAICYLWFAHGPDVQGESGSDLPHDPRSILSHKSECSIEQGKDISAVTFVVLHARRCLADGAEPQRDDVGDSGLCR